eukprot:m.13323 g.13323  ORF g.13323 m.13323 type:complete len:168 (-) comp6838_c1_seq1:22-525(-)
MTLLYTGVAAVLYSQIVIFLIVIVPLKPIQRLIRAVIHISPNMSWLIYALLLVVGMVFAENARESYTLGLRHDMQRMTGVPLAQGLQDDMRMFRAQRNLYISGFCLVMLLVVKRTVGFVCEVIELQDKAKALQKDLAESTRKLQEAEKKAAEHQKAVEERKKAVAEK